jgi:hypothetical protein
MRFILMLALIGACCLSAAETAFAAAKCESLEARCAVAVGGQCDHETGHWCYGTFQGRYCGGNSSAWRACMTGHGPGNSAASHASTAHATSGDRCVSDQERCAKEVGGFCNPRTGAWCVGGVNRMFGGNRFCGGTSSAFMACLDRVRAARK